MKLFLPCDACKQLENYRCKKLYNTDYANWLFEIKGRYHLPDCCRGFRQKEYKVISLDEYRSRLLQYRQGELF